MSKRKTTSTRHLEAETMLTTITFNTSLNYAISRGLRENLQEDNVDNLPKSKASTLADWANMRFAPRNLRIVAVSLCYSESST